MSILVGGFSLIVGARLLTQAIINEASNRVRLDLNTAREIYRNAADRLTLGVSLVALQPEFRRAVRAVDLRAFRCAWTPWPPSCTWTSPAW